MGPRRNCAQFSNWLAVLVLSASLHFVSPDVGAAWSQPADDPAAESDAAEGGDGQVSGGQAGDTEDGADRQDDMDDDDDMDEVEPDDPMDEDDWCGLWDETKTEHPTELPDLIVEIMEDRFSDPIEEGEVPEDEEELPCLVLIFQDLIDLWPTFSLDVKESLLGVLPISEHPKYLTEHQLCNAEWLTCDGFPHMVFHWEPDSSLESEIREICRRANEEVWPKLTGAWAVPTSDEGCPCNGGDGRLDVYVTNLKGAGINHRRIRCVDTGGETLFSPEAKDCEMLDWCNGASSVIVMSPWRIIENLAKKEPFWNYQTVAHELTHSIQWLYGPVKFASNPHWSDDWSFWQEATATWAEDFVYPEGQFEHLDARVFFRNVDRSYRRHLDNNDLSYGSYLYPFFWAGQKRGVDAIKSSWEAFATRPLHEAIAMAVPNAWTTKWDQFAVELWNQEPVDGFGAMEWDGLDGVEERPKTEVVEVLIEDGETEFTYQPERQVIEALSLSFFDIVVADESVRQIVVVNPFFGTENSSNVSVQALVQIGEEWMEEPVSMQEVEGIYFCRGKEEEKVNRVILIVAGRLWVDPDRKPFEIPDGPWVVANRIGCDTWTGTVSTTIQSQHASGHRQGDCVDSQTTLDLNVDLTFQRALTDEQRPAQRIVFSQFQRATGVLRWDYRGSFRTTPPCAPGECTFSESGEIVLGANESGESMLSIAGSHAFGDIGLEFGQYFVQQSVDLPAAELAGCSETEDRSVEGLMPALREALQMPRLVSLPFWSIGLEDGEALGSEGSVLQGSLVREMPREQRGLITTESSWSLMASSPGTRASTDSGGEPPQD